MENIHKNTQLEVQVTEQILQNLVEAKSKADNISSVFGDILLRKITDAYKVIDSERLQSLFDETIAKINEELSYLFSHYQIVETEFYGKNLKTADLIFNTLNDKRTQRIYLDNLLKKIDHKSVEDSDAIFTESAKNKFDMTENTDDSKNVNSVSNLSIDQILNQFVRVLVNYSKLTTTQAEDLRELMQHYCEIYKGDILKAVQIFLDDNKSAAVIGIEREIDKREIRNGKTRAVAMMERSIINNSQKIMEEKLANTISKYKQSAIDELKICSSSIIEVIFRLLPSQYQDQRGLLEIIIDTNINERLVNLLDTEIKKLADNLCTKNQDIIVNELYEEKRYKNIEDYNFDIDLVEKVYQDVLHEIRISYDIQPDKEDQTVLHEIRKSYNIPEPEDDENRQSKRLNLVVMSESNSTKNIFKNLVDSIKNENTQNLKMIILEMHRLSQEAQISNPVSKAENIGPTK